MALTTTTETPTTTTETLTFGDRFSERAMHVVLAAGDGMPDDEFGAGIENGSH